jgi:hypothetical protein
MAVNLFGRQSPIVGLTTFGDGDAFDEQEGAIGAEDA